MTGPSQAIAQYSGYRCRSPDDARWLALDTPALHASLRQALVNHRLAALFGSLAAGADIVIAELALAQGCALHVFVPESLEWFARQSVTPAGPAWQRRFDAILPRAERVNVENDPEPMFASTTRRALLEAADAAASRGVPSLQLAIWDGIDTGNANGTAADIRQARALGFESIVLPG